MPLLRYDIESLNAVVDKKDKLASAIFPSSAYSSKM